jgi:hypothetical protein
MRVALKELMVDAMVDAGVFFILVNLFIVMFTLTL